MPVVHFVILNLDKRCSSLSHATATWAGMTGMQGLGMVLLLTLNCQHRLGCCTAVLAPAELHKAAVVQNYTVTTDTYQSVKSKPVLNYCK